MCVCVCVCMCVYACVPYTIKRSDLKHILVIIYAVASPVRSLLDRYISEERLKSSADSVKNKNKTKIAEAK